MTQEIDLGQVDIIEAAAPSDLTPNLWIVANGTFFAATISFLFLPWPLAAASTLLALFMLAGADVDARTFLLPDVVTYGALVCGLAIAPVLALLSSSANPSVALGVAVLRAAAASFVLYFVRAAYKKFRGSDGLGLGDVKLTAAVGAWLPLAAIPFCFLTAATAALVSVAVKQPLEIRGTMKLPFGTFLCPALWLVFFINALFR